jgi:hypothetical protein
MMNMGFWGGDSGWSNFLFVVMILVTMIFCQIITLPHWLMFKPRWSARLIKKYIPTNALFFSVDRK